MTFLGLEQPIDYGRQLVFDPSTALMVLDAQRLYINAVYNDYQLGLLEMKDFKKEYGDFMSPIAADQEWWDLNVTGPVRNLINEAYKNGVDLLRSPQGRAMVSQMINSRNYGMMSLMRISAANAESFLKAKLKLQAEGRWNLLLDQYDGPNLSDYSTLKSGVWDRMSPTPYENMADFSKSYFDNIKPFKSSASRNGISYTKSEISMDDLRRIAKQHHNDLVNTPQGQMMYKYYKDLYGSDEAARNAFDEAVVSGNTDRLYYDDNYDEMSIKNQQLGMQREGLNLRKQQLALQKQRLEYLLKAKEAEQANRWTTRQRNDIAARAAINESDINQLKLLQKETTFNGARQALINEHKGDKSYNPTTAEIELRRQNARRGLGHYGIDNNNDPYDAYYRAQSANPKGNDAHTARAVFDNFNAPEQTGEVPGQKANKVSFGKGSGLKLTKIRSSEYGNRKLTAGSATSKLQKHLEEHNVSGYRDNDNVTVNHRTMASGVSEWDINGTVRIRKKEFDGLYKDDASLEAAVKAAGGSIERRRGKSVTLSGKLKDDAVEWVILPVTRTTDPDLMTDTQIDTYHEQQQYGKKYAHSAESQFINEDLIDDYE